MASNIVYASMLYIASISSKDGFPVNYNIRSNWFKVEFPGNIGFPVSNSPIYI